LPFSAQYFSIKIESLKTYHLSQNVILAFLDYLENQRNNIARTRNQRLGAIKSFSKMIRLFYPDHSDLIEKIMKIPEKKTQGFRDYTILHLLYDSGARASEIANLNIDYFDPQHKTLAILGKGNRYRLINICTKTVQLIRLYIIKYRIVPKHMYHNHLFINQRREKFSRSGINKICKNYLSYALPEERVKMLNPVSSFRHSCAVDMLCSGKSPDEIKYHLGHQSINSTMVYLHLDLNRPRNLQKKMIEYSQSILPKEKILAWLDKL